MDCIAIAFQNTYPERFQLLECLALEQRKAYLDVELFQQHCWMQQIKHNKLLMYGLDLVVETSDSDEMVSNSIHHIQELERINKQLEELVDNSVSELLTKYANYIQTAYQHWQSDAAKITSCNGDYQLLIQTFGQMVFLSELQVNYYY